MFRRQHILGRFITDFYCARARLVIELDGWTHDGTVERDEKREEWLAPEGFEVVRLRNMDVIRDADATATSLFVLAEQLAQDVQFGYKQETDAPHPNPLPRRREGTARVVP